MCSSSSSVVLGVLLQQDDQNGFLIWLRYPRGVSRYMQGMWELKYVLVLSNAQPYERGLPIYNRVCEVPFDIPQGYVQGRSIYRWYVEEPHRPRDAVQARNDISYV